MSQSDGVGPSLVFETPVVDRDARRAAIAWCRWAGIPIVVLGSAGIGVAMTAWGGVAGWVAWAAAALLAIQAARVVLRECRSRSIDSCILAPDGVFFGPDSWGAAYEDVDFVRGKSGEGSAAIEVEVGGRTASVLLSDPDMSECFEALSSRCEQAVIVGEDDAARMPIVLTRAPNSPAASRARATVARHGRRLLARTALGALLALAGAGLGLWLLAGWFEWLPGPAIKPQRMLKLVVACGVLAVTGGLIFLASGIHWILWRDKVDGLPPSERPSMGDDLADREAERLRRDSGAI